MILNTYDIDKFLEGQFLEVLLKLVIIYLMSVLFSGLAKKFRLPAVLGYIIGGLLLGLFLGARTPITYFTDRLNGFTIDGKTMAIYDLSQIGVILLLFMAGLGTDFEALKENIGQSTLVAVLGVVVSILLVGGVSLIQGDALPTALAMGVVLASTSVSISIQTLKEMGKLGNRTSVIGTGAAIIDDIIGLVLITLLGIFLNPQFSGLDGDFYWMLAKIGGLFLVIGVVGWIVVRMNERIVGHSYFLKYHDQLLMAVIAFCFILAFVAQYLGISIIIGAYFAGLMLSMTKLRMPIEKNMTPIAELFFAPIFFMSIGITLDLTNISGVIWSGLFIAMAAAMGKVIGCGTGAYASGLGRKDSLKVGIGMVPRGEVAFITASIAAGMGLLEDSHLAIAVIVVIMTSILTPTLLKKIYSLKEGASTS